MLHAVAIVFHPDRTGGGGFEFIDQSAGRLRLTVGGYEALARKTEPVRSTVMRGAEDHESSISALLERGQCLISSAIRVPAAIRTGMRRSNCDCAIGSLRRSYSAPQQLTKLDCVGRIS